MAQTPWEAVEALLGYGWMCEGEVCFVVNDIQLLRTYEGLEPLIQLGVPPLELKLVPRSVVDMRGRDRGLFSIENICLSLLWGAR